MDFINKKEFKDIHSIPFRLKKNGETVQEGSSGDMIFDIDELISYLSKFFTLKTGDLLGEIAFFTNAKERTLTARAEGDCEVLVIEERDFMRLYGQNPAFGLYILRLVAERLLDGVTRDHTAYTPVRTKNADASL